MGVPGLTDGMASGVFPKFSTTGRFWSNPLAYFCSQLWSVIQANTILAIGIILNY